MSVNCSSRCHCPIMYTCTCTCTCTFIKCYLAGAILNTIKYSLSILYEIFNALMF